MSESMEYPEALEHGPLEEVVPNVFVVKGTYKATYGDDVWQFSRNMTVFRQDGQLTLINSVRLNDAGIEQLQSLGEIKNVIKLGASHGIDDPYYVNTFGAKLWMLPGDANDKGLSADEILSNQNLPQGVSQFHSLTSSTAPEAFVVLDSGGGVLVSCDGLKNWDQVDSFFSPESGDMMTQYGMIKAMDIDMNWVKNNGISADDYKQVAELTFQHFVPGHGSVVTANAASQVKNAIESAFVS